MGVLITSIDGNPNVGLYGYATDKYVLLSRDFSHSHVREIEDALNVPAHQISIAGTPLIGIFLNGTGKCLLVPDVAFDSEIKLLEKTGIPFKIVHTKLTCLGNNLLIGPKGVLANPEFQKNELDMISEYLGLPVEKKKLLSINAIGSLAVSNNKKLLIHHDISDSERREIEKILGVHAGLGTLNMGNPYIRSGMINNKHGYVIGQASGGPEINNAEQVLGYLKGV